jgi:hypothetical protein
MIDHVDSWRKRVRKFELESHKLFAKYETSASRVIELKNLVKSLSGLPVDIEGYFREATDCLEYGNLRAAVVMAWAGFFSVLMEKLYAANETEIRTARPKWKFKDLEELKETNGENALLVVARDVKFLKRPEYRKYDGQLATRNQCAHPTLFQPSPNEAIGFVDLMVSQTRLYL